MAHSDPKRRRAQLEEEEDLIPSVFPAAVDGNVNDPSPLAGDGKFNCGSNFGAFGNLGEFWKIQKSNIFKRGFVRSDLHTRIFW
jgi:hypothetical protein